MSRLVTYTFLALAIVAWQKHGDPRHSDPSERRTANPCRPAALRDLCRMCCGGPPPVLTRRVDPSLEGVRRPAPSGIAILEVGIDVDGRVVSACVVRGVRDDFDRAAQSAAMQSRWKITPRKRYGVVVTVTACTPDLPCGNATGAHKK